MIYYKGIFKSISLASTCVNCLGHLIMKLLNEVLKCDIETQDLKTKQERCSFLTYSSDKSWLV